MWTLSNTTKCSANSNGIQEASWRATVELLGADDAALQQVALFPGEFAPEQEIGIEEFPIVSIRLSQNRCAGRDNGAPAG